MNMHLLKPHRIAATTLIVLALSGAAAPAAQHVPAKSAEHWVGSWGYAPVQRPPGVAPAALLPRPRPPRAPDAPVPPPDIPVTHLEIVRGGPQGPATALANVTVRQLVRVAVAGSRLRLRLTNEGGPDAMALGAVHVALAGEDGAILPGSDHAVTFGGQTNVLIPSSAPMMSDPIALRTKPLDRLLVSLYVTGTMPTLGHTLWQYVADTPGDSTSAATLPGARMMRLPALVSQVESDAVTARSVVVALGDSITEGASSTPNAFRGWVDRLTERMAQTPAMRSWSVVNAGIGGNRLMRYGTGPAVLARFDRDVLGVPGVKTVILLEGINDLGGAFSPGLYFPPEADETVTAESLEGIDKQLIARAHAYGIRVIGATLTPYEGANYFDPRGEVIRKALNQWIRTGGAFDGVIDFDAVVRDPAHPDAIRTTYNIYDRLHPNDAGYRAMADAIDLKLVTGAAAPAH